MIEIWTDFARFKTTNQRLTDQVRTITKNCWFSDLEIWEIPQQIYRQTHQQTLNTVTETLNTGKPETLYQTLHDNDPYTANTPTQTLTQEGKMNVDILKRIISEKKTTLTSLRNQDWRTVKYETEKVKDLLTNIMINDITKLNDLIYAGAKLVCEKIGDNRKSKPGWELRLESQIKGLRQQAKMLKRNIKIFSDEIEKVRQLERKIKLEESNQKILAKEGRLKRYWDGIKQYKQKRTFQNNEMIFYQ